MVNGERLTVVVGWVRSRSVIPGYFFFSSSSSSFISKFLRIRVISQCFYVQLHAGTGLALQCIKLLV